MGISITRGLPPTRRSSTRSPTTKVFTDDDRDGAAGSGEIGMVAAGGNVPLGYYKDAEKSARTFRVIDGVRYSFPGDLATVDADGTLNLLGRGSQVINTGGEKVFPEEVEEAVKRVPGVSTTAWSSACPTTRFGEAVTAVRPSPRGDDRRVGHHPPRSSSTWPASRRPDTWCFVDAR